MTDTRMSLDPSGWFMTYTGQVIWPLDPKPEDFRIEDIARSLSLTNRFNGHLKFPYSVAQHSLIVSRNLPPELALEGLAHDFSEAYLGDLIRPLKRAPEFAFFVKAEERLEAMLAEVFRLKYPFDAAVKEADNRALVTERRDVLNVPPHPGRPESWVPYDQRILEMDWREVERQFLVRFHAIKRASHESLGHQ
jgi:5'-deoxynucleotidase YfbR-like HD superfamily hydrolase